MAGPRADQVRHGICEGAQPVTTQTVLRIAVVGHTNTGKTSLLRTLLRDTGFGEVSNRPATTRRVECAPVTVDGEIIAELYDTPGLEDSIGLLELLERMRGNLGLDWTDTIRRFVQSDEADGAFAQEARTLSQILQSDMGLYVIDARDEVLGKHRDELEILGRTAIPVVPVLNFTSSPQARVDHWREQLARVNMHAVVEFDTVVLDFESEQRLYESLTALAGRFRPTIERLVQHVITYRDTLLKSSSKLLADMLIDAAAHVELAPADDDERREAAMEEMKVAVRAREQRFVEDILGLHRFSQADLEHVDLPIRDGEWGHDLFSPEALRQFGLRTGSAAAAGAAAGLALDVLSAGLSLGVGTATGAAVGALFGAVRDKGREITARLSGQTELRVGETTLGLLAVRNLQLIESLFRRGHASSAPHRRRDNSGDREDLKVWAAIRPELLKARAHPAWSRLRGGATGISAEAGRRALRDLVADGLVDRLSDALGRSGAENG